MIALCVGSSRKVRRVLRGGAFNNNTRNVRCAYRNRNETNERDNNVGFRVMLAAHDFQALFSEPLFRKRTIGRKCRVGQAALWLPPCQAEAEKDGTARSWPSLEHNSERPGEYGPGSPTTAPGGGPWVRPWIVPGVAYSTTV